MKIEYLSFNLSEGCPCEQYDCHAEIDDERKDIHLLLFNPKKAKSTKPNVSQFKWTYTTKNKELYNPVELENPPSYEGDRSFMCSFTNHGLMFLAGGEKDKSHRRRFYQLREEGLHQLANLPFDFAHGQCVGNLGEHGTVLFCSDFYNQKTCWSWDGYTGWHELQSELGESHYNGGLEKFEDTAIAMGGQESDGRTEILV